MARLLLTLWTELLVVKLLVLRSVVEVNILDCFS